MKNFILIIVAIGLIIGSCAKINRPDIENKEKALKISQVYRTTGYARDVHISDNTIYVAQDETGIIIFDRTSGDIIGEKNDIPAEYITVLEQDSFMVTYSNKDKLFHCYDFTNLDSIYEIGYGFEDWYSRHPKLLTVNATKDTLQISYITKEEFFIKKYYLTLYSWQLLSGGSDLTFSDKVLKDYEIEEDYIYFSANQCGFFISDYTGQIIGTADTPGEALAVKVIGDYAYIADRQAGLQVIDISDKENPRLLDGYDVNYGYAQSVDVEGNYLAVGFGGGGIYLFSISNPATPQFIDKIGADEVGYIYKCVFSNGELFLASRDRGVIRLTIS